MPEAKAQTATHKPIHVSWEFPTNICFWAYSVWIRKDRQPFKLIGFETFPGFEMQAATPPSVVQGLKPENFNDVLSGIFYGWIHSNVGTLVQARAGKGKLLICTFSLGTTYGSDPYATYLLDGLVQYIVSGPSPTLEIPLPAP